MGWPRSPIADLGTRELEEFPEKSPEDSCMAGEKAQSKTSCKTQDGQQSCQQSQDLTKKLFCKHR